LHGGDDSLGNPAQLRDAFSDKIDVAHCYFVI
jgi:hypothetical protein